MISAVFEQRRTAGEMICKCCGEFSSAQTCHTCNKIAQATVKYTGVIGFLTGTLKGIKFRVDDHTRQAIDEALRRAEIKMQDAH